jgi:hypothetical protein
MSNVKGQRSNEFQIIKFKILVFPYSNYPISASGFYLTFGFPLAFAYLPVGRDFDICNLCFIRTFLLANMFLHFILEML